MRKQHLALILLLFTSCLFAQEKHVPLHGGIISPVVIEEDHSQMKKSHNPTGDDPKHKAFHHNTPQYMAELVFENSQSIKVFLFDLEMKPLPTNELPEELRAKVRIKGDMSRGTTIDFEKKASFYNGSLPNLKGKSYKIEIEFIYRSQSLHIGYEN